MVLGGLGGARLCSLHRVVQSGACWDSPIVDSSPCLQYEQANEAAREINRNARLAAAPRWSSWQQSLLPIAAYWYPVSPRERMSRWKRNHRWSHQRSAVSRFISPYFLTSLSVRFCPTTRGDNRFYSVVSSPSRRRIVQAPNPSKLHSLRGHSDSGVDSTGRSARSRG